MEQNEIIIDIFEKTMWSKECFYRSHKRIIKSKGKNGNVKRYTEEQVYIENIKRAKLDVDSLQ